ncbi:hypothetical protein ACS0TY_003622 [Phlomoides rotata]
MILFSSKEIMMEVSRREKEANIVPDPDIDIYMKANSVEGQNTTLQTDYILKVQKQSRFASFVNQNNSNGKSLRVASPTSNVENFSKGELQRFGNIELNPSSGILNYGQGLFEGLKAYRKHDGNILLFCPEENAMRLRVGTKRMCMPAPTVEQFVEAVKATVLANERWVQKQSRFDSFVNQNNSNAASQNALDVVNAMLDADPSSARIVRKNCKTALHTTVRIISFYDLETVKIRAKSDMNAFHGTARTLFICHLWEPTSDSTWNIDFKPFVGHTASVEDLQWSPTEQHVFTSCSVDGNIAFWDIHLGKSSAVSIKAHDADVNVITWNSLVSCMLASGSDDGTFSIRDQRLLKEADSVVARFDYHKHPITSIEWSPHEASTLAVTSSDNQLTVWDLSLERDEEEEAEFKAKTKEQVNAPTDLPQQLLFVHQVMRLQCMFIFV